MPAPIAAVLAIIGGFTIDPAAQATAGLISAVHVFWESAAAGDVISSIRYALDAVYSDIAEAHFSSAMSALNSALNSSSPQQEVRICIAHLRDAFHVYEALTNKTVKKWVFLWEETHSVLEDGQITIVRRRLFEIASIIAVLYAELSEMKNASDWKNNAMQFYDEYIESMVDELSEQRLYNQDKTLAYSETKDGHRGGPMNIHGHYTYTNYYFTDKGRQYVKDEEKRIRRDAALIFSSKNIQ